VPSSTWGASCTRALGLKIQTGRAAAGREGCNRAKGGGVSRAAAGWETSSLKHYLSRAHGLGRRLMGGLGSAGVGTACEITKPLRCLAAPAGIDPSTAAFWDFTWDDMAAYDIPALVAYVLRITGSQQAAYVGHSQASCF
jgi:hypothetical protein